MVWWNAATNKNKDKDNGSNINYDIWQRRQPRLEEPGMVTHRKRENERREFLQGIPRQVWQTHRHRRLAQPDDNLRRLRPAKHQEHVPLDRIRWRMEERFAQRIRLLAQMLRRWHQSNRLRRQMAQWQPRGAMVAMNEATRETREMRERIQNSIIGKCICLCIYVLTLFLQGAAPPVNPPPTAFEGHVPTTYFHHRFLDLSLIS